MVLNKGLKRNTDIHVVTERFAAMSSETDLSVSPPKVTIKDNQVRTKRLTRDSIERAVKKLEFGRINSRTDLYLREEIASPCRRDGSVLNR